VDGVREAVVVAQRRDQHDTLVAYIVPTTPRAPDVSTLRRVLGGQLPDYMVPATYVVLDALPLLPSGKVDRRALPEPTAGRPELAVSFVAPRNEVEAVLVAIWAEILGLDGIGVHDEFLDLGGDSLSATRIMARVTDQFEVMGFDQLLWEATTVARMAAVLARDARRDGPEPRDAP
jgi:acyl carrier protein